MPEGDTALQDIDLSAREMRIGDNRLCQGEELLIENRSQRFYLEYDRTFALEWNEREGCLTLEYFPENYGRGRRKQKVSLLRNLRIILDATSVEIFVNDGEAVMSSRYYRNAERMLRFNGEFDMEMYELDLKNC